MSPETRQILMEAASACQDRAQSAIESASRWGLIPSGELAREHVLAERQACFARAELNLACAKELMDLLGTRVDADGGDCDDIVPTRKYAGTWE